jgi:HK97 family phage prohead protease
VSERLSRAFVADLSVRSDGRTIAGIVVPYNREALVSDGGKPYREMFAPGAFKRSYSMKRIPLLSQHDMGRNPLGVADRDAWREDAAGLYAEFRVSATQAGDEALALVRDGALDSFSVGFRPVKHSKRDGVVVREEAALRETSLVTFPAYEDARISAVRAALLEMSEEERAELLRMYGEAHDLAPESSDSTPTEAPESPVDAPASATRDALTIRFSHLRALARRKDIL